MMFSNSIHLPANDVFLAGHENSRHKQGCKPKERIAKISFALTSTVAAGEKILHDSRILFLRDVKQEMSER
jgi:hypothetical protein